MTGDKDFLETMRSCKNGNIVFGDGSRGRIQGMGNRRTDESLKLKNVLLVKGLVSDRAKPQVHGLSK
jgi:hypothetical protein